MKRLLHFLNWFGWPTLCGLLIGLVLLQQFPALRGGSTAKIFSPGPIVERGDTVSYSQAVEDAAPAVVNIYTTRAVSRQAAISDSSVPQESYSNNRIPRRQKVQSSLGSGVIVSKDGYILTNNHVISGADNIIVALKDLREIEAVLIGSDPETDLAVLKIELPNLPTIDWANSKQIKTGDVVLAIGNPFGLGQTVSMGIISATRRNLRLSTYESFIQTDAAINVGNSGGALINARGDLVGISTALISSGGGSEGLGFAIPSNLARFVLGSIVERGRVVRGWLGIESQALNSELAEAFNLPTGTGILVSGVYDDSPASEAGLQRGDIIVRIDDMSTDDGRRVMNQVAKLKPGSPVAITVQRGNQEIALHAVVSERPPLTDTRR